VEKKAAGDGYVECPVLVKRTGTLEYVSNGKLLSNPPGNPRRRTRGGKAASAAKRKTTKRQQKEVALKVI